MGVSENTVYPPNSYFDRENDDNPMDLGVHYFQTNPYDIDYIDYMTDIYLL